MATRIKNEFDSKFPVLSHMYENLLIAPFVLAEARAVIPIDWKSDRINHEEQNSLSSHIHFRPKKLIKTAAFIGWLITAIAVGVVITIATAGTMSGLVLGLSFIVLGTGMVASYLIGGNFKERKCTLVLSLLFGALALVIGAIAIGGVLSPFVTGWIASGIGIGAIGLVIGFFLIDATQAGIRTYLWHRKNAHSNLPVKV